MTLLEQERFPVVLKRLSDIALALMALLVCAPLLIIITVLLAFDGGYVLFIQPRVGLGGRLFRCYKFRTMVHGAEGILRQRIANDPNWAHEWTKFQKIKEDDRITPLGKFLRSTSLDELPQLWNVLVGDMSLVGPRPILPTQRRQYGAAYADYIKVRPGITGPWQVGGRNTLTFQQRASLEREYVVNWNLWADCKIIMQTIPALLQRGQAF